MKTSRIVLIVVLVVLVLLVFRGCSGYNNLVTLNEQVSREWANVENVYQRRADLIPNLVNTVKGYAAHEQTTLTQVVEARANATKVTIDPSNMTDEDLKRFQAAQGQLNSALSRLIAVAESYPDLKANQNFIDLQRELAGTENRISVERRKFNETATTYNSEIRKFPMVLFSGMFGFKFRPYFEAEAGAEKPPVVQF
ncbi:MAG TPA: LemA family protein [Bacteroidales bacterium]|nr:LemA family protein [Bacteroidales bacterium]